MTVNCPQGGADAAPAVIVIDLDRGGAKPRYFAHLGVSDSEQLPIDIALAPGKSTRLFIAAQSDKCFCEWTAKLKVVDGSKEQWFAITDNGRPFRAFPPGATLFEWSGSRWEQRH